MRGGVAKEKGAGVEVRCEGGGGDKVGVVVTSESPILLFT